MNYSTSPLFENGSAKKVHHTLALVLLAAGASSRLGTCKALASLSNDPSDTPLRRLLAAGAILGDAQPLLVAGCHRTALQAAAPAQVEIAYNARWREGRTGSVAVAAAARAQRDLLLAPVDVPRVPKAVFESLDRAWSARGCPALGWLAPFLEDSGGSASRDLEHRRFGHPIILGRLLAARLAALLNAADTRQTQRPANDSLVEPQDWRAQPLRAWRARATPLLSLAVEAPQILENLDTREDLECMRGRGEP